MDDTIEVRIMTTLEKDLEWKEIPAIELFADDATSAYAQAQFLGGLRDRKDEDVYEVRWNWQVPFGLGQGHYIPFRKCPWYPSNLEEA